MVKVIQERDDSISMELGSTTISHIMQVEGDSLVEIASSELIPHVGSPHSELSSCYADNVSISPNGNLGRKVQAIVTVSYKTPTLSSGGGGGDDDPEPEMSFDCGGGTMHMTHALAQRQEKGDLDAGVLIGWNGKGGEAMEITGVDVPCAQLRESYTRVMKSSRITTAYKKTVAGLVGKVNSNKFKGWDAGEVMFLGMSYSAPTKGSEKITVTYNFAIQLNEKQWVDDTEVEKTGFEYAWVISHTEAGEDQTPKVKSDNIYVATVCAAANFSALGL